MVKYTSPVNKHGRTKKTYLQLAIGEARIGVSHAWEVVVGHDGGDVSEWSDWVVTNCWRKVTKERKKE